jgi:hypothetical protein
MNADRPVLDSSYPDGDGYWNVRTIDISQERVDELKECVHEFFTKYLNHVEESDSGREFNPVTIGCCRALMLEPLNELIERMRVLSGADRNPLWADGIDLAKVGEVGVWGDKREWVGFTHEELAWLNEALALGGRLAVIEAIEAKLKEKNT